MHLMEAHLTLFNLLLMINEFTFDFFCRLVILSINQIVFFGTESTSIKQWIKLGTANPLYSIRGIQLHQSELKSSNIHFDNKRGCFN